jgi:hypothetical protein
MLPHWSILYIYINLDVSIHIYIHIYFFLVSIFTNTLIFDFIQIMLLRKWKGVRISLLE